MKTFLLIPVLVLLVASAFADSTYLSLRSYECATPSGISLKYEASQEMNFVQSEWMSIRKTFYADGARIDTDSNTLQISFTGHRPSAGPSYDPWESDFRMEFPQTKLSNSPMKVRGKLFRSTSFAPFVEMSLVECSIVVGAN